MALGILSSALILQTFHEIEHVAQFYQRWWLGVGPQEARGILFFLDVEWNHFLFNIFYFPLLGGAAAMLLFQPQFSLLRQQWIGRIGLASLLLGLLVQGYHVLEHTVRMGQYFQFGCTPCPGILGKFVDLVYLHFVLNTSTWLLPMGVLPALWQATISGERQSI